MADCRIGLLLSIIYISQQKINHKNYIPLIIGILLYMYVHFVCFKNTSSLTYSYQTNDRLEWKYSTE